MKLAELLFDRKMNVSGVKVWFGNNVLDISTLKEVWSFLNQELGTEDPKEEPKPVEKKKPGRPKKENTEPKRKPGRPKKVNTEEERKKNIDAIKKAVADRKKVKGEA